MVFFTWGLSLGLVFGAASWGLLNVGGFKAADFFIHVVAQAFRAFSLLGNVQPSQTGESFVRGFGELMWLELSTIRISLFCRAKVGAAR